MNRGELVTISIEMGPGKTLSDLREALCKAYEAEPFVTVLEGDKTPSTRMVRGSNQAVINVFAARRPNCALVVCAIDNLVKGSSGQALQNFNIMMGLSETLGLEQVALFP